MLDHPQDAYRLARERQQNFRNSANVDRQVKSRTKSSQNPMIIRKWKRTLLKLRKVQIDLTLIVQE